MTEILFAKTPTFAEITPGIWVFHFCYANGDEHSVVFLTGATKPISWISTFSGEDRSDTDPHVFINELRNDIWEYEHLYDLGFDEMVSNCRNLRLGKFSFSAVKDLVEKRAHIRELNECLTMFQNAMKGTEFAPLHKTETTDSAKQDFLNQANDNEEVNNE